VSDKLTKTIGVPLSEEQYNEIQTIIKEHAPDLSEGKFMRMAWLFLRKEINEKGALHVLAEILGA
jgi:hypothetical protein